MRRAAPLICVLAILAGCGGGEEDEATQAEQTVRDFVAATRDRDADAFCEDLVTREFLEQVTGATGDRAKESCRREFAALTAIEVRLVRIVKTEVDEDRARVSAVLDRGEQNVRQTFSLKKEDGDWKLAGGAE